MLTKIKTMPLYLILLAVFSYCPVWLISNTDLNDGYGFLFMFVSALSAFVIMYFYGKKHSVNIAFPIISFLVISIIVFIAEEDISYKIQGAIFWSLPNSILTCCGLFLGKTSKK